MENYKSKANISEQPRKSEDIKVLDVIKKNETKEISETDKNYNEIMECGETLTIKKIDRINDINDYKFTHFANTLNLKDSAGSPIFLGRSNLVIGMNKESNKISLENYGDFTHPAINTIKEGIRKKRNTGKYINGKYIWEDKKYYVGEFKNSIPNGKGIKYYSNENILYDGYFINGKF